MSKHRYSIDEFNGNNVLVTPTKAHMVEKKVSLLRDFCILEHGDDRESLVEYVLNKCSTEEQMSVVIHDILVGRETLDAMLKRKGVM